MWTSATTDMIITGIGQTLYMTILFHSSRICVWTSVRSNVSSI